MKAMHTKTEASPRRVVYLTIVANPAFSNLARKWSKSPDFGESVKVKTRNPTSLVAKSQSLSNTPVKLYVDNTLLAADDASRDSPGYDICSRTSWPAPIQRLVRRQISASAHLCKSG